MTDRVALSGRLGLGTAPLGGLYDSVDDETAHAVVERAWELGIRYFDTAPYYGSGSAERRLGAVLCDRPRDEFVLSTKVGRRLRPGESDWRNAPPLQAYFDFSHDATLRSLEESLERLELDRVDIALIHDPDDHYDEALAGAVPALARLRDEGVVRAIGVGMNQTELLCRFALETDPDYFLVAGRYTLLDRSAAEQLLPLCVARGIAVIASTAASSPAAARTTTTRLRRRCSSASPSWARSAHGARFRSRRPLCSFRFGTRRLKASSSGAARRTKSRRTCASSSLT